MHEAEDSQQSRFEKAQEAFDSGDFYTAKMIALSIIVRDLEDERALELSALASEGAEEFSRAAIARSQLAYLQNSGCEYEKAASAYLKIGKTSGALYSYNEALRCYQATSQTEEWERVNMLKEKLELDNP